MGSVTAGMAIYDTMQQIRPDVRHHLFWNWLLVWGRFLLCAGAKGKRLFSALVPAL